MSHETISQRQLNRMVDGELALDQQRGILLRCEEHPRLWRDLALAYVESQSLGRELKGFTAEPGAGPSYQRRVPQARRFSISRTLALAAAVLLSVVLGYVGGFWWQYSYVGGSRMAEVPLSMSNDQVAGSELSSDAGSPVSSVQLTVADAANNEFRQIDVPVMAAADLSSEWMAQMPAVVPGEILHSMERLGHEVRQNRRLIPMRLRDGRRIVLPYQEIEVTFTGYQ